MRKTGRIDGPQRAIVDALRMVGCEVVSLSNVGNGCPDLLVFKPNRFPDHLVLLEVKAKGGKLTADQQRFLDRWPVRVVTTPADAIKAVQ